MNETHMARIQDALPVHTVIYIGCDRGFTLSGVPLGGENYILAKLQKNLDKTTGAKEVIANICKLKDAQEQLVLLLQCIPGKMQHLLAAVLIQRDFYCCSSNT